MSSEIRSLLEAAQRAEAQGDRTRAVARLQEAAEFYRARRMERRAAQMERHIDRLEGRAVDVPIEQIEDPSLDHFHEEDDAMAHVLEDAPFDGAGPVDDGLGFGDELLPTGVRSRRMESGVFDRGPQPADPAIDAWCSFSSKPKAEVGSLIAGPAGAFICASCLSLSARLLSLPPVPVPPQAVPMPRSSPSSAELPGQTQARADWELRKPRVALVIGPEGSGKSAFLESLGRPLARPFTFTRADGDLSLIDVSSPMSDAEEIAVRAWLDGSGTRRVVLAARGIAPAPVLVLQGEHGEQPVYDTDSLHRSVDGHVPVGLLAKVDSVFPLPVPDRAALTHLGTSLLASRAIDLPAKALETLVELAERSGRGARELAALIARIPSGRYKAP